MRVRVKTQNRVASKSDDLLQARMKVSPGDIALEIRALIEKYDGE